MRHSGDDTEDTATAVAAAMPADIAASSGKRSHHIKTSSTAEAVLNGRKIAATTTTNTASTLASIQMSPSSCTVLIVDKQFLKGVYYTPGVGSPTLRAGPARDDVVFVQELLEIYGQVVAVVSGDTALRWIFNHTGNKAIIVLIDVDDTYGSIDTVFDETDDSYQTNNYGPIYTPISSPQDQELSHSHDGDIDSEGSGPYGLALLRVIAHYVAIGVFRNVAPIGAASFEHASGLGLVL